MTRYEELTKDKTKFAICLAALVDHYGLDSYWFENWLNNDWTELDEEHINKQLEFEGRKL